MDVLKEPPKNKKQKKQPIDSSVVDVPWRKL
jgi:hypothetical protein